MGIESGTTIEDLQVSWPTKDDYVLDGDNHIRLIKSVLQSQFPGVGGGGFASVITATEDEINSLSGANSNIQQQIDDIIADYQANLYAPSGTIMVFYQSAPPTGWTQVGNNDNSMSRVVSGAGGGSGG